MKTKKKPVKKIASKRKSKPAPKQVPAKPPVQPTVDLREKAKRLRELARAAERAAGGREDRHREIMAERERFASRERRDIGPIPDIEDIERREACAGSLRLFCETYNPEAFSLSWSDYQLRSIDRIEEAVKLGALYAMAEPRGGGKTTRLRMAALWAIANGLRRYVFLLGATDPKAVDSLDSLKMFMRFLPLFVADYPEICYPIQKLEGEARRVGGQTCGGKPTLMEWTSDRIVLPTVPPPENWPGHWPLRPDGMVTSSGSLVATSGLTGEGIRGSLKTIATGEQLRPDLVLLDDPQTNESARSRTQNVTREQLISADVLGMAGPGKSISAMMACTIIAPGDCIDRMTDRAKHPAWRGERTRMLPKMPTDMTAWDAYFEVYRRCLLKEPPDFEESNSHYAANQAILEAGAEASWSERKLPGELSAIQSAMHLYHRDRRAFMSEYQNDPDPIDLGQLDDLNAGDIAKKKNGLVRGLCPRTATHLTVGVDVQASILFYTVAAWSPGFAGAVVDYGAWPKQGRSYFAAADARPSLEGVFRDEKYDENARIFAGLKAMLGEVVGRAYPRDGGGEMRVARCLVDSGKWDEAIRDACRRSPFAALLMVSKGYGIGAGAAPMANWGAKPGEKRGEHWIERANTEGGRGRLVLIDTNYWKSFVARRLQTPEMGAGCLQLWGDGRSDHQLYADHLTAEYRVATSGRGRKLEEWKLRPERPDNHFWDTLVYATVAAAQLGLVFSASVAAGEKPEEKKPRVKVKMSELFAQKHGGGVRV